MATRRANRRILDAALLCGFAVLAVSAGRLGGSLVPATFQDFHLSGTQILDVPASIITTSDNCMLCHGPLEAGSDPYATWSGSLMAMGGRDPLFFAQMTTANQDVANAGYFCMRCHVPLTFATGHASQPSGSTIDAVDRDGVSCHFCHSMVDPIYKPGISPVEDESILASLAEVPNYYGNAMFVLDPMGTRRGPREDHQAVHDMIVSPFHRSGDFCGTCHDVGNVAVSRQPDGSYQYNALGQPTPSEDLHMQFPLERTYSEWKLSEFATTGVDMGGRFGGAGVSVVGSCQDCHMPRTTGEACVSGPTRPDLARHDFAGASAWPLEIIALHSAADPAVDQSAIRRSRQAAVDMLERAASLELGQECSQLQVRVTNESGHKLPTGHIEGRRVWLNVQMFDAADVMVAEYGHYDSEEAHLDEKSTTVFEMHVGLSPAAAVATGLPEGVTTHMALADTIVKDNRIPPRGFNNAAYAAAGAPVVGATYADGQHWADLEFVIPPDAVRAAVTVNYQTVTRHYIEALRDANHTDRWGQTLYSLWLQTDKGPPIPMISGNILLSPAMPADLNCDRAVNGLDLGILLAQWAKDGPADLNGDGVVNGIDLGLLLANWTP